MRWPANMVLRYFLRIFLGLALGAVVVAGYAAYLYSTLERATPPSVGTVTAAPAFDLIDQHGKPFSSRDLAGKVWVASFISARCAHPCRPLTSNVARLQDQLAAEDLLGHVMLVSFSVDPVHDAPAAMRAYLEAYGADQDAWRFLTGPPEALSSVLVDGFFMPAKSGPGDGAGGREEHASRPGTNGHDDPYHHDTPQQYEFAPSNVLVVVDAFGNIQDYYDGEALDLESIMDDLRFLAQRR